MWMITWYAIQFYESLSFSLVASAIDREIQNRIFLVMDSITISLMILDIFLRLFPPNPV